MYTAIKLVGERMKKVILTDIDGVVLDWEEGFSVWMEHHGHSKVDGYQFMYTIGDRYGMTYEAGSKMVKQFNESAAIGFLPPLRDAQFFVKKLHEQHQYKFICITSLSLDPYARQLRTRNLKKLMGDAFLDVVCLDTGADKDEILKEYGAKYPGAYWIEDKVKNAVHGAEVGLQPLLMKHPHIKTENTEGIPKMSNWRMVYETVGG